MDGSAHLEFPEKLSLLPLSPILLRGQWFPPSHRKPPPFLRLPPHLPICWRSPESIRYSSESPGLSRLTRRPSDGSCPVTLCWSHLPSVHPSCRTQTFVINTQERVSLHASISTMDRWRFYMWNRTLICEIKPPFVLLLLLVRVQWSWQRLFFCLRFLFVPKKIVKIGATTPTMSPLMLSDRCRVQRLTLVIRNLQMKTRLKGLSLFVCSCYILLSSILPTLWDIPKPYTDKTMVTILQCNIKL